MKLNSSQICFGLSEKRDRESFATFLQLAGRKEFVDVLATRMNSDEIDTFVSQFTDLLRKHLSEEEYHTIFLLDENHSH